MTDRELIWEYANGNLETFHEFYGRYKDSLFTFLKNRCGEEADDFFQITFSKFIDAAASREIEKPKSYLFQIAINLIRNRKRETKVVKLEDYFDIPDPETNEDNFPVTEEEVKESLQKLASEKPVLYEVLHLHIFEKMTFEQIGIVLQKSKDTAASRYRYAINFMRKKLMEYEPKESVEAMLQEV